jgi:catechol 2,3-dioxygenase-like lactoylglutathione lyase family enzyme
MLAKGIFHAHLIVRDIERSIRFYGDTFGYEDTGFRDGELVFMRIPGTHDLLTLNPSSELQDIAGVNGGVEHFGIRLGDFDYDAWVAEVERNGGRVVERGIFPNGVPSLYIADPDGYVIELQGPLYDIAAVKAVTERSKVVVDAANVTT